MNYTVTSAPAVKNTITITRNQLWKNYVDSWSDMVMDGPAEYLHDMTHFQRAANILCNEPLDSYKIRQLFRQGDTYMLMGDAMRHIDTDNDNTLVEIVITDGDQKTVIFHNDIRY
jgi:hypothetical protein